ncbi:chemotaxis protein CheR [Scytonema sp. UIC 10036]|uniref:CheR family methyltransferase n=1 Tax=Scytonema sp. UIC 10036 TaxID=2304196 RepID=UPI0012DA590D|nr:CheR family methyltransferase [Scytonema sp. UIC 10036]MUG98546.1 chemotaxis protein CheR [Scytonema sp. UIC 10036]
MTTSDVNPDMTALLDYLKQNCGCDLTGNKSSSLTRRFQRRMQQLNIENYKDYLQYIQEHPSECTPLLDTIFINFSGFFRDPNAWDYLANKIIPQIIANKQPDERIRVWSAGCASGQEVYTLVMLLVEALGSEQYLQRVQIFATDIDEDAIAQARRGSYSHLEIAGISSEALSKYFEQTEQGYVFRSKLRRPIVFGRHDLAVNAPMSKIDLLVCRNVLIYLKRETQASIFVRFHFALTDEGFLFLGKAESLTNERQIFTPVSLKHSIFAKGQNLTLKDYLLIKPRIRNKAEVDPLTTQILIWQAAFLASPFAQVAVARNSRLLVANQQAYALFGLKNVDLGARLQDLEIGRLVNSIAFMRQLDSSRHPISLKNVQWVSELDTTYLDIHITPILYPSGKLLGANLTFIDVTECISLADDVERLNSNLAKVTVELQETKKILYNTIAELESTQKELESLNQEIEFRSHG